MKEKYVASGTRGLTPELQAKNNLLKLKEKKNKEKKNAT